VLALGGHTIALEPADVSDVNRLPSEIDNVYLSYGVEDAIHALRGRLVRVGDAGDLRFLSLENVPQGGRTFTRIELVARVRLRTSDSSRIATGRTVNVSAAGAPGSSSPTPEKPCTRSRRRSAAGGRYPTVSVALMPRSRWPGIEHQSL
jgi:hypothetical protein